MRRLKDYKHVVDKKILEQIKKETEPLKGQSIIHLNSTYTGGGVAELLTSLVLLFNDVGVQTGWRSIKGNADFFAITKSFHNSLQGDPISLSHMKKKLYEQVNEENSVFTHITHHDCVIVHDPQPLPLIKYYKKSQPWIWRCHIDLSHPNHHLWRYLNTYIRKYDHLIISKESFKQKNGVPQTVIHPSIDPLSLKNKKLSHSKIKKNLSRFGIEQDKPIISQVSRFDKWKDPVGVIRVFKKIRKEKNAQLVLLGSMATDDPEGQAIYEEIVKLTKNEKDIHVINYENNILVNAVQSASDVVLQKSLREGFGLTVSEALWKKTPVVATKVGGIPLQIKHGYNGYLINNETECVKSTLKLLNDRKLANKMGENGHEYVKEHFLVTRHMLDYTHLLKRMLINYKC